MSAANLNHFVAQAIRLELDAQERSVAWLSRCAPVPLASLHRWLKGLYGVPIDAFVKCADALDVEPDAMLRRALQLEWDADRGGL